MGTPVSLEIPTQILEKISFFINFHCYGKSGFTRNSDTDFGKDKLFKTFNGTKTSKIIFSVLFDTDFGKDKPTPSSQVK